MKKNREKVILIGLDGATFDLLNPWITKGELPSFKKIRGKGVAIPMLTTIPPISASAWVSLFTGKNPGKHRIVDFFYRKENTYDVTPMNFSDIKTETLFSMLSRAKKKVILVNIPITYPPEEVNGILITGLHTPSENVDFVYPKEFKKELNKICNGYKINAGPITSKGDIKKYLDRLYDVTEKQMKAVKYLMKEKDWDFFMYVIQGTDQIQHALWHFMDEKHPLNIPNNKYKNSILNFYQRIDTFLKEILQDMSKDTTLIIISDHGAGPIYKFINLNTFLIKKGFMKLNRNFDTVFKTLLYKLNFTPLTLFNVMVKLGLGAKRGKVTKGRAHGLLKRIFLSFDNVDWEKTKAYALGNGGQIYINLKDREPLGCVRKEEYKEVGQAIINELMKLKDEDSSSYQLRNQIFLKKDIYIGNHLYNMPDLVFWPKESWYNSLGAYEFPSNRLFELAKSPTATHKIEGIFIAYGNEIANQRSHGIINIMDITPTILNLMGIEVENDFDGRILTEILKYGEEKRTVIRLRGKDKKAETFSYSKDEIENIKKNLTGLGYIG